MKKPLQTTIEEILANPDEAPAVICAALEASAAGDFPSPAMLVDLTSSRHDSVKQLAWQIIRQRGLVPLVRPRLLERLYELERELVGQTEYARMSRMNQERALVIRDLAIPEHLELILKRRFALGIEHEIERVFDELLSTHHLALQTDNPELARLLHEHSRINEASLSTMVDWCRLIEDDNLSISLAAAHLLSKVAKEIPVPELTRLVKADLSGRRLSALATIVAKSGKTSLSTTVASLLRSSMRTIRGHEETEAWGKLCLALKNLDDRLANRTWVVGLFVFYHERLYAVRPGYFPLVSLEFDFSFDRDDYDALFDEGGDAAKAAAYQLSFYGLGSLLKADSFFGVRLSRSAVGKLNELAEDTHSASWQARLACAAAYAHSLDLLPWLVKIAGSNSNLVVQTNSIYDREFARTNEESLLAVVFRAIGALSRFLLDDNRRDEAEIGIAFLRKQYRNRFAQKTDPSIIAGLTTGLCYLGKWKPVLANLGEEFYYVHVAAENVFDRWIPRGEEGIMERERAAQWIARRRIQAGVPPAVRDTLNRLHDKLCKELGRFIDESDDIVETDDPDGID